jgi:hypothetical protein
MGSAQSTELVMPEQVVHDLHREDQVLQERSMCGCGMQSTRQRTEEYVLRSDLYHPLLSTA